MTTDILNLPKWDVIELEEGHDEYTITTRYTVQPRFNFAEMEIGASDRL